MAKRLARLGFGRKRLEGIRLVPLARTHPSACLAKPEANFHIARKALLRQGFQMTAASRIYASGLTILILGLMGCGPEPTALKRSGTTNAPAPQAKDALAALRLRADQGDGKAQATLGEMYFNGDGVSEDIVEALRWYRKAADQGDADAQSNLGVRYAFGSGVAKDDIEAMKWFRKAADQGHAGAQFNLGEAYATGEGMAEDQTEAVKWYRKAAEQGVAKAQIALGLKYATGRGVVKDETDEVASISRTVRKGERVP